MALTPRIEVRQNQSLVMTPQLQQAIKLLQMSNLELAAFVATEVEKNPLLELAGAPVAGALPPLGGGTGAEAYLDSVANEVTLRTHLHAQIGAVRTEAAVAEAALILVDEIEEDGYLRVELAEVAARHRLTGREAAQGLTLLQSCDPAGVGARNLKECLALQLRERDRLDPAMHELLVNLDMLGSGALTELQEICGVDAADLADMLAELRALDPQPGTRFAAAPLQLAIPDVYVRRTDEGRWLVELNTETLPRVLVENQYAAQLGGKDAGAVSFVSEMSAAANWLVRSLEQRARTILKVASEIVLHQERFFGLGVGQLRPLTQRAVADRLGLHESTVSRVAAGKFMACDRGLFEMRFFFSSAIQALSGGEAFSATAVQDRIRLMIQAEAGGRALSDDKIVAVLNGHGIDIARRTVAKYRDGMGIPSSVERRRRKVASPKS